MPQKRTAGRLWPAMGLLATGLFLGSALERSERVEAASPEAWEEFRAALIEQCGNAAALATPYIRVDPFGTQSYGIARITGTANGSWQTLVCVAQKTPDGLTAVEVSAPLEEWVGPDGE